MPPLDSFPHFPSPSCNPFHCISNSEVLCSMQKSWICSKSCWAGLKYYDSIIFSVGALLGQDWTTYGIMHGTCMVSWFVHFRCSIPYLHSDFPLTIPIGPLNPNKAYLSRTFCFESCRNLSIRKFVCKILLRKLGISLLSSSLLCYYHSFFLPLLHYCL